jgi:hypothetical protein
VLVAIDEKAADVAINDEDRFYQISTITTHGLLVMDKA